MRAATKWISDKSNSKFKGNDSSVIGARARQTKEFKKRREKANIVDQVDQTEEEFSFFTNDVTDLKDQRVFVIDSGFSNYMIKDRLIHLRGRDLQR